MRTSLVLAVTALSLAGLSAAASAAGLSMASAETRSEDFARHTCSRDASCTDYGVLNCRRRGPGSVLCRIYDDRRTRVQGHYRCERLVRVGLDPRTNHRPITGLGRWHC